MAKRFERRVEDFVCDHCGQYVRGDGYTDHCSTCLWSKHVDINPGDRAATCGGMMEPVRVEGSSPQYTLVHRCERCGYEHRVMVSRHDDPNALVALANRVSDADSRS